MAPSDAPRRLEARLSEIVHDVRIVTIPLPSGGELQLCLGVDRRLSAGESDIAARRAALARQPNAWKKRLELAERLYHSGRWDEACEAYRAVLSLRPDSAEATLALGRMLRYEKRDAEAAGVLRAAPESGAPGRAALIRAELRVCEGDDEGAVSFFAPSDVRLVQR